MQLMKMIADLKQEREGIEDAILTLERLAANTGEKRRGRPPEFLRKLRTNAEAPTSTEKPATRQSNVKSGRTFSRAQKKAQSLRMKKMWAAKKNAAVAKKRTGKKAMATAA